MLINVGDEIQNCNGDSVTVTDVEQGQYGLLIKGQFQGSWS